MQCVSGNDRTSPGKEWSVCRKGVGNFRGRLTRNCAIPTKRRANLLRRGRGDHTPERLLRLRREQLCRAHFSAKLGTRLFFFLLNIFDISGRATFARKPGRLLLHERLCIRVARPELPEPAHRVEPFQFVEVFQRLQHDVVIRQQAEVVPRRSHNRVESKRNRKR